jgi:enolase
MTKIRSLQAREILDSRGKPTVEVYCILESNIAATATVPSGASTGTHEAHELRDGDAARYRGLGVLTPVASIAEEVSHALIGNDYTQKSIDEALIALDGTEDKSRLGANAILAVSLAFARANAQEQSQRLYEYIAQLSGTTIRTMPKPMLNVINGGRHADSGLDIQEFMIIPRGFNLVSRGIQAGAEVMYALRDILAAKGYSTSVGDEGGFAPKLSSNEEALEHITAAIKRAGYTHDDVAIGIDAAASEFFADGMYQVRQGGEKRSLSSSELIAWYTQLVGSYPIISLEDPCAEDDWDGFAALTKQLPETTIVGDDLTVTNVSRIQEAIARNAINAVLLKLNQIGTLTETIEAAALTRQQGWKCIVSHRSGETDDTFIADLAVGVGAEFLKSGSLQRGERVAKYNRLMEIELMLHQ